MLLPFGKNHFPDFPNFERSAIPLTEKNQFWGIQATKDVGSIPQLEENKFCEVKFSISPFSSAIVVY